MLGSLVGEIDGCHATRGEAKKGLRHDIFETGRCTSSAMQLVGAEDGSCKYLPSTAHSVIPQYRVCSPAFKSGMPAHNLG